MIQDLYDAKDTFDLSSDPSIMPSEPPSSSRVYRYAQSCLNPCELVPIVSPGHTIQFYKMMELIGMFQLRTAVSNDENCANSVHTAHLCEAPGSFVHAVCRVWPDRADWRAMSIKTMGAIDFFPDLVGESRRNGRMRVSFGDDETGDITVLANAQRFARDTGYAAIDLVTADGQCSQSTFVACEIYTALLILRAGGCLILRVDDTIDPNIIKLLCLIFNNCAIARPVAVQIGSMERYVLCRSLCRDTPQFASAVRCFESHGFLAEPLADVDVPAHVSHNICKSSREIFEMVAWERRRILNMTAYLTAMGITTPEAIGLHATNILSSRWKLDQANTFIQTVFDQLK